MVVLASLNGLGSVARARSMVVKHPRVEREQLGRVESVHAGMIMGLFIAHYVIMFVCINNTSKVS